MPRDLSLSNLILSHGPLMEPHCSHDLCVRFLMHGELIPISSTTRSVHHCEVQQRTATHVQKGTAQGVYTH